MKLLRRVAQIRKILDAHRKQNRTIGFIPTMGALHNGHISLASKSVEENDITVVTIFVNPTQFNQKEDLEKYPRNLERDMDMLTEAGVDYVFAPPVDEVYPEGLNTGVELDIEPLIENMEGPNRPGHFEGVIQVVHRFLRILEPDRIYMGQKDYQQFSLIRYMIDELSLPAALRVCPIIREENGVAMSSRNERLSPELKEKASIIYKNLCYTRDHLGEVPVDELESRAMKNLDTGPFRPEYFEIFDGESFERIVDPANHEVVVAGTAVWAGDVRLIDNMILKGRDIIYKD